MKRTDVYEVEGRVKKKLGRGWPTPSSWDEDEREEVEEYLKLDIS